MQTVTTEAADTGQFTEATASQAVSYASKALALDIVNTARRIGYLDRPVLTDVSRRDALAALATMKNLVTELEFELGQ